MAVAQGVRQRTWPWTLAAIAVGFLLVIVQPPLVLVLLIVFGILAIRDRRRPDRGRRNLAIFRGLAVTTCYVVAIVLAVH